MLRAAAASLVTALIFVGAGWATGVTRVGAHALRPSCPQARYGVDGTMGPVFCVVDNPVALNYYAKFGRHLFALGPNASPDQVVAAIRADDHDSTLPILCETYRLAAWREQWRFPSSTLVDAAFLLHAPRNWCSEPSLNRRIDY